MNESSNEQKKLDSSGGKDVPTVGAKWFQKPPSERKEKTRNGGMRAAGQGQELEGEFGLVLQVKERE